MSTEVRDFIPTREAEFSSWANTFADTVTADPTGYGFTVEEAGKLQAEVDAWDAQFSEMFQKREAARAATVAKDTKARELKSLVRQFARQIQADPNVTDAQRANAGLPIHSTTRTPVPVPSSAPIADIKMGTIREHRIRFRDSIEPNSGSRPRGVFGVQIYLYVGESSPLNDDQYTLLETVTRMEAVVNFSADDAGKSAFYLFRYINTRGELGPWSTTYNATIAKS